MWRLRSQKTFLKIRLLLLWKTKTAIRAWMWKKILSGFMRTVFIWHHWSVIPVRFPQKNWKNLMVKTETVSTAAVISSESPDSRSILKKSFADRTEQKRFMWITLEKYWKKILKLHRRPEMISILPLTAIFRSQYIRFWSSILPELYTIRFLMPRNLIKTVFHQRMTSWSRSTMCITAFLRIMCWMQIIWLLTMQAIMKNVSTVNFRVGKKRFSLKYGVRWHLLQQRHIRIFPRRCRYMKALLWTMFWSKEQKSLIKTRSIPMTRCGQNGAMTDPSVWMSF